MKKLDLYIIKKFLGTYFFSIVLIISIAVIFDYNENVAKFTEKHAPWEAIVFDYYLNFIPFYANLFSGLFVFLSVIFFTTKLADNSEIIAMLAAGVSYRRLLRPYMISTVIIALLSFVLGAEVIPRGNVKRVDFENTYKRNRVHNVATYAENVQLQVAPGLITYMQHFDGRTHTGYNFTMDQFKDKKLICHLSASSIAYDTIGDVRFMWHMKNVQIREMKGMKEHITHYDQMDTIITMEPRDFLFVAHLQETMTNEQLREYINRQKMRGSSGLAGFEVEYQKRFAAPFSAFILALIGFALSAKKKKGGMGMGLGLGIGLSAGYILLQTISSSFSTGAGMNPMLAAWIPNILFSFIALWLVSKLS